MKKEKDAEKFERCILCGAITYIPISMHIDWRENYEVGCGQLCVHCAKKQREEAEGDNILSDEQVFLAVEKSVKEEDK